eukprot:GHVU01172224.1.p1 GENE.GHVU01172224.1~~GHVU01172224.1.p1  ORF type:complete len:654 (+),score=26.66 GHVU01172224.1:353-2314(+)
MKKTLLTALLSTPFLLFAQQPVKELNVPNQYEVKTSADNIKAIDIAIPAEHAPGKSTTIKYKKDKNFSAVKLADTYYDLQTNASPGRRIVLHADGTVSAVWTASPDDASGYPNRGSGYNHFDGGSWLTGREERIEGSTRTGWPSIMLLDGGREMIMSHESNTGGFTMTSNNAVGSTTFTSTAARLDDETELNVDRVPIWNRSVATNGKIHTISNYWASEAAGIAVVTRNGVNSPTTYSRWDVASDQSDVEHILLPGYDSTLYEAGGGDSYAIDARGNTVAILIGGLGDPVSLWKSTDNGVSWTYTDVDNFPFKGPRRDEELTLSGDTIYTNDGSLDVMIDASGNVHAFYGRGRVVGGLSDAGDTSFFFFPAQTSLMHWTEGDAEPKICGSPFDRNGDGTYDVTTETFQSLDANGNVPTGLLSASRTGATSLVTMPSASTDADGNLFVVYSVPVEGAVHFLNSNYRDIVVSYSTDGGATWNGPQNITQDGRVESNFPCVAKDANDFLHLVWQEDATPGTFLQNHSASAGSHPNDICAMMYAAIPVSDILNDVLGNDVITSVDQLKKDAEVFVVSQNQPNPFSGSSEVIIYLRDASPLTLTVTDMLGNVLNTGDLGTMNAGNHSINIDATNLSSGMYFYTISSEYNSVTKRMQVK